MTERRTRYPTDQCHRIKRHRDQTCIEALADGWIQVNDFCPPCTRWFIATINTAGGHELPWHHNYRARGTE